MNSLRLLSRWLCAPALVALVASVACSTEPLDSNTLYGPNTGSPSEADSEGAGDDYEPPPAAGCDGPLGAAQDPSGLEACCPEFGHAHCLDEVNDKLANFVGSCEGGGYCVPDKFIETGGVLSPKECTSLSDAEGVCLSLCSPKVSEKAGLLPQDVCDSHERCVPCISPLDGSDTKACTLAYTCEEGYGDGTTQPSEPSEPVCPHEGAPLMDVSTLKMCDGCGLGHCLSNDLIPPEKADMFSACDATSSCVPDKLIETGGNYIAPTCESIAGVEGRCLSTCLPSVAAKEGALPQSSCGIEELCVPCYDPITGADSGACKLSCDPGPGPKEVLPECCNNLGTCFPKSGIPSDKLDSLPTESVCPEEMAGEALVCVPTGTLLGEAPKSCSTKAFSALFGEEYKPGACLPSCLPSVDNPLVGQDGCADGFKCAPCLMPPLGEPTGACDGMSP